MHFKSVKTGKALFIRQRDIVEVEWLRVARGFEVKLITVDGQVCKFDGFKESVSTFVCVSVCSSCIKMEQKAAVGSLP